VLCACSAVALAGASAPPRDPPPGSGIGRPKLNLSIPNPPEPKVFTDAAKRWARTEEQWQACELAIDRWEQAERAADEREFAELNRTAEEMSVIRREGPDSPRRQQGAEMLLEAVHRRALPVARRIERERTLVLTLATLCERSPDDPEVAALRARLTAARGVQLSSPFAGSEIDLGSIALEHFASLHESRDALAEVARSYWLAMEPLWEARYRSQCEELEEAARDAISRGGPGGVARPAVRRAASDATERIIWANDAWIASFVVAAMPDASCAARVKACRELLMRTRDRRPADARPAPIQFAFDPDCCADSPRARVCAQARQLEESIERTVLATDLMLMRERVIGPKYGAPLEFIAVYGARDELEQGIELSHAMALEAASGEDE
jgi:hypothetical protein